MPDPEEIMTSAFAHDALHLWTDSRLELTDHERGEEMRGVVQHIERDGNTLRIHFRALEWRRSKGSWDAVPAVPYEMNLNAFQAAPDEEHSLRRRFTGFGITATFTRFGLPMMLRAILEAAPKERDGWGDALCEREERMRRLLPMVLEALRPTFDRIIMGNIPNGSLDPARRENYRLAIAKAYGVSVSELIEVPQEPLADPASMRTWIEGYGDNCDFWPLNQLELGLFPFLQHDELTNQVFDFLGLDSDDPVRDRHAPTLSSFLLLILGFALTGDEAMVERLLPLSRFLPASFPICRLKDRPDTWFVAVR